MPWYSGRYSSQKSNSYEEAGAAELGAFDLNDLATGVMPAILANAVRKHLLPAVGADDQRARGEGVVCPTTVAAAPRNLSFWQRWHVEPSSAPQNTACHEAGSDIIAGIMRVSRWKLDACHLEFEGGLSVIESWTRFQLQTVLPLLVPPLSSCQVYCLWVHSNIDKITLHLPPPLCPLPHWLRHRGRGCVF